MKIANCGIFDEMRYISEIEVFCRPILHKQYSILTNKVLCILVILSTSSPAANKLYHKQSAAETWKSIFNLLFPVKYTFVMRSREISLKSNM